jgi:hypothetical protein
MDKIAFVALSQLYKNATHWGGVLDCFVIARCFGSSAAQSRRALGKEAN